ncbi:MAG: T9SS type A sorting domain-containing protein [Ignavibacteria bacterium]|nr:T9SS type A sorting domain-containing protein [Ignavibacteria bacterium]
MKYLIILLLIIICLLRMSIAQTWSSLNSGTTIGLTSVCFTSSSTGWATGWPTNPAGVILKTTNSGNNWVSQSIPAGVSNPNKIFMINSTTGYICTRIGNILKTTNGGTQWSLQYTLPGGDFLSVKFANSNTGFAVGYPGLIVKTTNAGTTWEQQVSGTSSFLYDVGILSADTVFATTTGYTLLYTVDGGSSWNQRAVPFEIQTFAITFTDANTGYAAGIGMYKTTNRGVNWTVLTYLSTFFGMYFLDSYTGYGVMSTGQILRTSNGGSNWSIQNSGVSTSLISVCFVNNTTGFTVGANGVILRTTDQPLPVGMSYFNSEVNESRVRLKWSTYWELNNAGFEVESRLERSGETGEWKKQGNIPGSGTTNLPVEYEHSIELSLPGRYSFRLKQIDYNGNYEYHYMNSPVVIRNPAKFDVSQNYPNPSNPNSKVDIQLPFDGVLSVQLFDITGKEMKYSSVFKPAGFHSISIDGADLSSGIYFYRMTLSGEEKSFSVIRKMILVK